MIVKALSVKNLDQCALTNEEFLASYVILLLLLSCHFYRSTFERTSTAPPFTVFALFIFSRCEKGTLLKICWDLTTVFGTHYYSTAFGSL